MGSTKMPYTTDYQSQFMQGLAQQQQYPPVFATSGIASMNNISYMGMPIAPERKKTMLENVKCYVNKHKDILFTLVLIILLDHFLFKGALKARIQSSIEGVLKTVEDRFHKDTAIEITPIKEA